MYTVKMFAVIFPGPFYLPRVSGRRLNIRKDVFS